MTICQMFLAPVSDAVYQQAIASCLRGQLVRAVWRPDVVKEP